MPSVVRLMPGEFTQRPDTAAQDISAPEPAVAAPDNYMSPKPDEFKNVMDGLDNLMNGTPADMPPGPVRAGELLPGDGEGGLRCQPRPVRPGEDRQAGAR
jgi:hypothetical protein